MVYRNRGPRPRTLDPIKNMLSRFVQDHLVKYAPSQANTSMNIDYIEAHVISPTETMLRVKTHNRGTRNFTIKIRENMLCQHGETQPPAMIWNPAASRTRSHSKNGTTTTPTMSGARPRAAYRAEAIAPLTSGADARHQHGGTVSGPCSQSGRCVCSPRACSDATRVPGLWTSPTRASRTARRCTAPSQTTSTRRSTRN